MDIAEFLLARIAEDEAAARGQIELREERYPGETFEDDGSTYWVDRGPWLYADPVRVLAECEAKRRIVEEVELMAGTEIADVLKVVCRYLAMPYAQHADYNPEWSPLASQG